MTARRENARAERVRRLLDRARQPAWMAEDDPRRGLTFEPYALRWAMDMIEDRDRARGKPLTRWRHGLQLVRGGRP